MTLVFVGAIIGALIVGIVLGNSIFDRWLRPILGRLQARSSHDKAQVATTYECMGFSVSYADSNGAQISNVESCKTLLDEDTVHVVAESARDAEFDLSPAGDLGLGEEGTGVAREFCAAHCIGGCNRGCVNEGS